MLSPVVARCYLDTMFSQLLGEVGADVEDDWHAARHFREQARLWFLAQVEDDEHETLGLTRVCRAAGEPRRLIAFRAQHLLGDLEGRRYRAALDASLAWERDQREGCWLERFGVVAQ